MKRKLLVVLAMVSAIPAVFARPTFNQNNDILVAQFDSKPDPDDIHAQAAVGCMLAHKDHSAVNYYAVAGAYGIQNGTFIDSDSLFKMAFGAKNTKWTDADADWKGSVTRIKNKVKPILVKGGKVWVAEAGQSNITADWIKALFLDGITEAIIKSNVIVVQHSKWNEKQTAASDLKYVKDRTTYFALDDGNAPYGNTQWGDRGPYSTPEYRSKDKKYMAQAKSSSNRTAGKLWTEADRIIESYYPGGYPETWSFIHFGGVDYSDTAEVWWILNAQNANSTPAFWAKYIVNE